VEASPPTYVSTGHLPRAERTQALVDEAHERHRASTEGANAAVYPALAAVPSDLFGICVVDTDGTAFAAGDADVEFTIMSVAKPFVFALVCEALGPDAARSRLGVNATGLPLNAIEAVERDLGGRTNPMVNPGAIAATDLLPGSGPEEQWQHVRDGLSRFAGRDLAVDDDVHASASATNQPNREIARHLQRLGALEGDPDAVVDLYTRQSCLRVTARDLALMGATLADGGVHPVTREQVVAPLTCRYTLAVMATAGLYETSGDWLFTIGLPAKSGIGGGIVTSAPGKGGLGTFAPRLDGAGNSVQGQQAARFLSESLGLNLFMSEPHPVPPAAAPVR
jgi:glutaminase